MLTIGQLAAFVGVTIRAIRHYHQRGLLPEPERDASGYRRYDGQAVIDLLQIKTLAEAGVPLARVETLLDASPEAFSQAIKQLDAELERRIEQLQANRQRLTTLLAGERLLLPDQVVDYLEALRGIGISETTVIAERDGWIVLQALAPDQVRSSIEEKRSALDDREFRQLYRLFDQAAGWHPDDPRLEALADTMIAFAHEHLPTLDLATGEHSAAEALLASLPSSHCPAWERLDELWRGRLAAMAGQRGGDLR